ncbi:MAG TPA: 4-hydroxythreonine-4-phosphate dehydrogenase PdxA, partial [Gemmatimonadales bacterium]|nr:4-hydroxythreonine-4-phosphate dehydrogenase PdxA [Gemmatimonadales bacterium]
MALTLGDPRGIGPEIVARVLAAPPAGADFVVIGPEGLIRSLPAAERIAVDPPGEAPVTDASRLGLDAPRAGKLAGLAVERAARLALDRQVDAIVTGPAEKRALHLAGFPFPGHTEWLAAL